MIRRKANTAIRSWQLVTSKRRDYSLFATPGAQIGVSTVISICRTSTSSIAGISGPSGSCILDRLLGTRLLSTKEGTEEEGNGRHLCVLHSVILCKESLKN